jgi:hypothetical protein
VIFTKFPLMTVTGGLGVAGICAGIIEIETDSDEYPITFLAATVNLYVTPGVKLIAM